jgi:hypothetical protein
MTNHGTDVGWLRQWSWKSGVNFMIKYSRQKTVYRSIACLHAWLRWCTKPFSWQDQLLLGKRLLYFIVYCISCCIYLFLCIMAFCSLHYLKKEPVGSENLNILKYILAYFIINCDGLVPIFDWTNFQWYDNISLFKIHKILTWGGSSEHS